VQFTMFDIIYRYDPANRRDCKLPADADGTCRRLEEQNRSFASLVTGGVATPRIVQLDI
jgi:hypothetical protein